MSNTLNTISKWLSGNGLSAKRTYQTISEAGAVLWNDEKSSLKIVSRSSDLVVSLVFLDKNQNYHFYEKSLKGTTGPDLDAIRDRMMELNVSEEFLDGQFVEINVAPGKAFKFMKIS